MEYIVSSLNSQEKYIGVFGKPTEIFSPQASLIISNYKTISDSISFKYAFELELSEFIEKFN